LLETLSPGHGHLLKCQKYLLCERRCNLNYQIASLSETILKCFWCFHFGVIVNNVTIPPIKINSTGCIKRKISWSLDWCYSLALHDFLLILMFLVRPDEMAIGFFLIPCATTCHITLWPKRWAQSYPVSTVVNLLRDDRRTNPGLASGNRIIA